MIYLRLFIYFINYCITSFDNSTNDYQKLTKPISVDNTIWNKYYDKLFNKYMTQFICKLTDINITSQDDLKELYEFGMCLIRSIRAQIEYRKKIMKYQYDNNTVMTMQYIYNTTALKKYLDLITTITTWIKKELTTDLQTTSIPYDISYSNIKSVRICCKNKSDY